MLKHTTPNSKDAIFSGTDWLFETMFPERNEKEITGAIPRNLNDE
jgi:hypothetical protein